jgi:hypothetical protein
VNFHNLDGDNSLDVVTSFCVLVRDDKAFVGELVGEIMLTGAFSDAKRFDSELAALDWLSARADKLKEHSWRIDSYTGTSRKLRYVED